MSSETTTYLDLTIKILDQINLWSNSNKGLTRVLKDYYLIFIMVVCNSFIQADFFCLIYDDDFKFTALIESVVALSCLWSVIYIAICFSVNRTEIKNLVLDLKQFEEFLSRETIIETENRIKIYVKSFMIYGAVGNIVYFFLPLIGLKQCEKTRSNYMKKYGIPCGMVCRYLLPFKYDHSYWFLLVSMEQCMVCILCTTIFISTTMLVCGILTHLNVNLACLKEMILETSRIEDGNLFEHVNKCIRYHCIIIDVSGKLNDAFSLILLIYITLSSFTISALGFEIIMETDYLNSIRFSLNLAGWILVLFTISFYGQMLINKGDEVCESVYKINWFEKPTQIRAYFVLMLVRSQRPLTLKAARVRIISYATFLGIMSASYSYLTLLLKIKP